MDEAHCISEWGHDFRPHYRMLGRHRWALGSPPAVALTATATSAIIYVPTRDLNDAVAANLRFWGVPAAPYHAGLLGKARGGLLARFLEGGVRAMAATNAFGMGIDKDDVRLVAHFGVPMRPEAYVQEAGRAGRDGRPAHRAGFAAMRRYVTARGCRRRLLLQYVGERGIQCGGCDRCGQTRLTSA